MTGRRVSVAEICLPDRTGGETGFVHELPLVFSVFYKLLETSVTGFPENYALLVRIYTGIVETNRALV